MKPTIDIFCGSPIEIDSEKDFLGPLSADLSACGERALILGNFFPPPNPLQIDFLVVTARCACHVELKKLTAPVVGGVNGPWSLKQPNGTTVKLEIKNPYRQALDGKFAISDAMSQFARATRSVAVPAGGRFVQRISSVVCVYPELLRGSEVFQDYKVGVVGYKGLLDILCQRDSNPGWSWSQWVAFAMHMSLVREDPDATDTPPEARAARDTVGSYNRRFVDFYRGEAASRTETTLKQVGEGVTNVSVAFSDGKHVQLLGPSGCGKTLLAKHVALDAVAAGRTPLFVYAKEYDGKLSSLLDRSVAHLHPDTALNFLNAASRAGARVGLVLDGFNECPPKLKKALVKDLQAFYLRWQVPVLVTSQEPADLPEPLQGGQVEFQPLSPEEKLAIVRSSLGRDIPEVMWEACLGFQSAYELSLLAECALEADGVRSRTELFEAYVRKRCDATSGPMIVRRILGALAHLMMQRLVSNLTMAEVWRVANKVLAVEGGRAEHVTAAINSGLLHVRQGRCSFRHEMLERWFQAEDLTRTTKPEEIGTLLSKPRNRALAEFVLGVEPDETIVRQCLESLADVTVVNHSLSGKFGEVAQHIAKSECSRILAEACADLEKTTFELVEDVFWGHVRQTGGLSWSAYDRSLLAGIGVAVSHGLFLDEYLRLVRSTEEACQWAVLNEPGRDGKLSGKERNAIFASLYVFRRSNGEDEFPLSTVFHAMQFAHFRSPNAQEDVITAKLVSLTHDVESRLPGELYVISTLLRQVKPAIEDAIPAILKAGWSSGYYHLRLEVLQLAQSYSQSIAGVPREEMVAFLEALHPKHLGLSTALVDTLMSYGMVESPVSPELASGEVSEILACEETPKACRRAYGVVSNIFEDVYQGAYWEAVEHLPREDRTRLLTMAALGAEDYGSSTDWILRELVKAADANALPAFLHWLRIPASDSVAPQEATAQFVAAVQGCAQHLDDLPELAPPESDDERAWHAYSTIIFWLAKTGIGEAERRKRCASVWKELQHVLAFQAVDPLLQFHSGGVWRESDPMATIAGAFPDDVRKVLEFGLRHQTRLTSVFAHAFHAEKRSHFIIHWLTQIGNAATIGLLEPYLDSPEVGGEVYDAIKALKARAG